MKKYDVFISYRRNNGKDLANAFNQLLKNNGFETYYDVSEEYAGDFREKITNVIRNSSLMLIIVSEDSLARMHDKEDISRLELETAMGSGVQILPISVIGDKMFDDINHPESPQCVKELSNYNTRFYTHEMQTDTTNFILNVCRNIRETKFNEHLDMGSYNFLNQIYKIVKVDNQPLTSVLGLGEEFIYSGNLKNNYPYGKGVLLNTKTDERYEIEFDGAYALRGEGKIYKDADLTYEGNTKGLKPQGQGVQYLNGETYKGYFQKGERYLEGTLQTEEGMYYEGEFRDGIPQGNGYIKYPNGDEYKGEFSKGVVNGEGTLIKASGIKFQGTIETPIGRLRGAKEEGNLVYVGEFDNDLVPVKNIKIYNLDEEIMVFSGEYKYGKKNGIGEAVLKGSYLKSLPLPQFKIKEIDYEVEFSEGKSYRLIGEYIDDKLQIDKPFHILDEHKHLIMRDYSNGMVTYDNDTIELKGNTVAIKCKNGTTRISIEGNYIELDSKYILNNEILKGKVKINLGEQVNDQLMGIDSSGNEVKVVDITSDVPLILRSKLDEFELMSNIKEVVVETENEGIVIEF